jgi:hypothetical protein
MYSDWCVGQVTVGSRDALQRSLSQLLTARDRLVTNYMTQLGALHTAWYALEAAKSWRGSHDGLTDRIHRCQPVVAQGTLFCYKRTLNPNNIEVPSTVGSIFCLRCLHRCLNRCSYPLSARSSKRAFAWQLRRYTARAASLPG